ncbi:hypothetical protein AB1L30_25020 [Bremerella sp. JC817]|uniref:hypothetical protein n=1 Tax=Bremerella sp. JC817 TaxID=3231756 RepID=UPI003457E03A
MTDETLKALQLEWAQTKAQLEELPAQPEDAESADLEAELQQRLDELEFEIALRQRGTGPCSLM